MPQKTWVVGEETLAADFNTYVQNQVVPAFPNVATRDSQWTAPPNGAICVTTDTYALWMRRAGAWQPLNAGGGVLGYAQVTTVQSPIGTSDTLITGLTLTVPVGASRRIKVTGKTILSPNAGAIVRGMIFADGVEVNRGTITLQNGEFGTFHVEAILSPTAASHTYAMYAATNTGQISSQAAATFPAFILVEDIGPV